MAPAPHTKSCKRKQRVLVVGHSAERHLSACLLYSEGEFAASQEPRQRVSEGHCTDHSPLLLFHLGTNDMVKQNLGRINQNFRALGTQVKGTGAQVIFSFVLPLRSRGAGRGLHIMQINIWLQLQGFGFYDHKTFFDKYSLLERHGVHLSRKGR